MITVLMPVFNGELYLKKSIKSVLNSQFKKFEFLIVDDGSTDNSKSLIKSFKDKRIRFLEKGNSGIAETLNYGLSKSKYELIARMDCDDIILTDRLGKQLKYFESNNVDVLGSNATIIDQFNIEHFKTKMPLSDKQIKNQLKLFESPIIHPSVLYKKQKVLDAGGYKENYADDYDLWLRMLDKNNFSNIYESLILLRKHESNLSKIKLENAIDTKFKSINYYYSTDINPSKIWFNLYKKYFLKAQNKSFFSFSSKLLAKFFKGLFIIKLRFNKYIL